MYLRDTTLVNEIALQDDKNALQDDKNALQDDKTGLQVNDSD